MKKFLLIVCALVAFVTVSAQPPMGMGGGRGGDRGARTIEMLQARLQMTPEAAKKFAPVYQSYQRELRQVRKETKDYVDSFKGENMTIKIAKKIMMAQLNGDNMVALANAINVNLMWFYFLMVFATAFIVMSALFNLFLNAGSLKKTILSVVVVLPASM